ncbi:hypothetical protein MGN70_014506 [Eutypa lata]|nr:hypothetical protein MGN70_014506 [Eutypa lata]
MPITKRGKLASPTSPYGRAAPASPPCAPSTYLATLAPLSYAVCVDNDSRDGPPDFWLHSGNNGQPHLDFKGVDEWGCGEQTESGA